MVSDFTLDKYSELSRALVQSYKTLRVIDYISGDSESPVAILRHDAKITARDKDVTLQLPDAYDLSGEIMKVLVDD